VHRFAGALAVIVVVLGDSSIARASAETCAASAERASDLRDAGKLHESLALFESCAAEACPRVVRDDCRKALFDLREKAPRIVVHVTSGGADVSDASVAIDGTPVRDDERVNGTMVDPGTHRVTVSKSPLPPAETTVVVALADRVRRVDVALEPAHTVTSNPVTPLVVVTPTKPNHTASFVFGGIGLALLAGFGVLGTWTYVDYQHLSSTCSPGCTDDLVSPLRTRALVADVLLGTGVASLVVATILWVAAPSRRTSASARAGWQVTF
jgi:hypothetical protein